MNDQHTFHVARLTELRAMQVALENRIGDVSVEAMTAGVPIRDVAKALHISHGTLIYRYGRQKDWT